MPSSPSQRPVTGRRAAVDDADPPADQRVVRVVLLQHRAERVTRPARPHPVQVRRDGRQRVGHVERLAR